MFERPVFAGKYCRQISRPSYCSFLIVLKYLRQSATALTMLSLTARCPAWDLGHWMVSICLLRRCTFCMARRVDQSPSPGTECLLQVSAPLLTCDVAQSSYLSSLYFCFPSVKWVCMLFVFVGCCDIICTKCFTSHLHRVNVH